MITIFKKSNYKLVEFFVVLLPIVEHDRLEPFPSPLASLRRMARSNIILETNPLTITQLKSNPSFTWRSLCPNNTFLDARYFSHGFFNLFLPWERYLTAKYEHHVLFFFFENLHSHPKTHICIWILHYTKTYFVNGWTKT